MNQKIRLETWSEIIGTFQGLSSDDYFTHVRIGGKVLLFFNDSEEAATLRRGLKDEWIGLRVGILRTGESARPLLVRILDPEKVTKKSQVEGREPLAL